MARTLQSSIEWPEVAEVSTRLRVVALCSVALAAAACTPDGTTPETPGPASPPTAAADGDAIVGAWLDLRLLTLDALLAEAVPIVFTAGADGAIGGTRPYSLHGEPPCGTISIIVWPEDRMAAATAADVDLTDARRMRDRLSGDAGAAGRFYLGRAQYPTTCGYGGRLDVATVVAFAPEATPSTDAGGPGVMHWCTPAFEGSPTCTAHVRR